MGRANIICIIVQYYGERLMRILPIPWIQETMPSSLHPPGAVVAVLRSVANIASAPSVPVSAGVSTSGEGGCLLQQSADTAALQRVNTLTFSRPDTQTQGSHFYPQLPELSRRRRREYNQEFAELLFYFVHKKYQSFKKCEFWSSRARHSPALAYQQTGQWRATLEIKLAPAINTAPTNHQQSNIALD